MPLRSQAKPYKIGSYGAGTLSCISNQNGLFVLFNNNPIAKRLPGRGSVQTWISLDPAWNVTPAGHRDICIQHNGGGGVFVSLGGGMK
jgi:hypothetical protein